VEIAEETSTTAFGTRMAYWRRPGITADPVVLLHGLGADHGSLLELASMLPGRTFIALDLPGFGSSEPLPVPHSVENYLTVLDGLQRRLGYTSFDLVGHSLGANIGLAYASRRPHGLRRLALLHPVIEARGVMAWLTKSYYEVCAVLPRSLARLLLTSKPVVYLGDIAMLTTRDRQWRRQYLRQDYRTARRANVRAMTESYRSLARAPYLDYAAEVSAETLLVTGALDELATPVSVTNLHRRIKGSSLVVVPEAGHLYPGEQAADLAALLHQAWSPAQPATLRRTVRRMAPAAAPAWEPLESFG
jgi:pimeloyl-ACP methyl ester carboxylesterase